MSRSTTARTTTLDGESVPQDVPSLISLPADFSTSRVAQWHMTN